MDRIKEMLTRPLNTSAGTHGWLLAAVGGYFVYMAYMMIQNTKNGESSMSLKLTYVLAAVMSIIGAAVIIYGVGCLISAWEKDRNLLDNRAKDDINNTNIGD